MTNVIKQYEDKRRKVKHFITKILSQNSQMKYKKKTRPSLEFISRIKISLSQSIEIPTGTFVYPVKNSRIVSRY